MQRIGINALFLKKAETGIGRVTRSLLRELSRIDNKNEYILYTDTRLPDFKLPTNFKIKLVPSGFYRREDLIKQTVWERVSLPREAEKDNLNIFFSPYNSVSRFKTIPNIVLLHDVIWKVLAQIYLYNFRRKIYAGQTFEAVRSAKKILTVSEFSRREINKHLEISLEKIKVIGAGISSKFRSLEKNDPAVLKTFKKFGIDNPYIFYIGGFETRKNVSTLINAFSKIVRHYKNNLKNRVLVIGGATPEEKHPLLEDVVGLVEKLGIKDSVRFVGKLSDEELIHFYNGADFFVFPSIYEGFGLTVLEAMACGVPIIASQIGSIKEVALDTVHYFHPEREDELVQSINRFLTDQILREELRVKAVNRARDFNWQKPAENLLAELENNAKK